MPLSTLAIKNAAPRDKSWKLSDGGGLYVEVTPSGSKLFKLKYRHLGKEKKLSFGAFPTVGLKEARERRAEAQAILAAGKDPAREKKVKALAAKLASTNTFAAVAREYIEKRAQEGIADTTKQKAEWLLSLLLPSIGDIPIAEVTAPELLIALQDIQSSGRLETARRLRSFAGRVFGFAFATGRTLHNPAALMKGALIAPIVKHYPAIIDPSAVGRLLRDIDGYQGYPSTIGALRLSPHLFQRPGEVRTITWANVDFARARLNIPMGTAKKRRAHEVPLSRQAIEIIRSMKMSSGGSEYVFPAFHTPKRPLSENTVNQALRRLGYSGVMTAHGFRTMASSLLNECNRWNPDAIERALSHMDRNQVRAAYNRTAYWNERVEMMQWWSDQLDHLKATDG